jgi:hypothetical protein
MCTLSSPNTSANDRVTSCSVNCPFLLHPRFLSSLALVLSHNG